MRLLLFIFCILLVGCAAPEFNPQAPKSEGEILGQVTQVTRGFSAAGEGYFSPDMRWIIFQAIAEGEKHYQMYLARLEGRERESTSPRISQPIRISPERSRNTCGYFSSDGKTLIFASTAGKEKEEEPTAGYQRQGRDYRWSFPAGMEIFRVDGWEGAVAGVSPGGMIDLAQRPITNNEAYDAEGAYSPDGKFLIFTSNRDGDLDVYVSHPDGTHAVRLTHSKGYDGGPFFSPDGKRVVYRSDRAGNDLLQIFVADLMFDSAGEITGIANERPLTHDQNVNWGPYWHPDGKHLIYATSLHGHQNYELYLMRDDGSRKTRITFSEGFDGLPVFSPDGKWLMWTSKRAADKTSQLFIARFTLPTGA